MYVLATQDKCSRAASLRVDRAAQERLGTSRLKKLSSSKSIKCTTQRLAVAHSPYAVVDNAALFRKAAAV